jgi:hypothetical protein
MIVWLASFPRSGNTMVRLLLKKVYGRTSFSIYDDETREAMTAKLGLTGRRAHFGAADVERARRSRKQYFLKTHGPPTDGAPALCIARDGRDALVSYAHFIRTYDAGMAERFSFQELLRILIESHEHFGGWSGHVRTWYTRAAEAPTEWVRYEDLLSEPIGTLDAGLRKLGVDMSPDVGPPATFEELNGKWPDFFRTGKPGAWRNEMDDELHELFWAHHEEAMSWLGYHRTVS